MNGGDCIDILVRKTHEVKIVIRLKKKNGKETVLLFLLLAFNYRDMLICPEKNIKKIDSSKCRWEMKR